LDVLSMLMASYLYLLCQALDLRTLRAEFLRGLEGILQEGLASSFGSFVTSAQRTQLSANLFEIMSQTFDKTTVMDSADQMHAIAASTTSMILDFFNDTNAIGSSAPSPSFNSLGEFRSRVATKATELHENLRRQYLTGIRGPTPATTELGKTKLMYEFIRKDLGVKMHGGENHIQFVNGAGVDDVSIGQNISKIYEAIRDGRMQAVVFSMFV